MPLRLVARFDLRRDVLPALLAAAGARGGGADNLENNYDSLRVLNVERNENVIYTYKDKGHTFFGVYDCQSRQNELLYSFETNLQVVSCSVNRERTLLAVSLVQSTEEGRRNELQPGSKCLTLLVEIHPINNVKVLKAVDSYIWVQFLYPCIDSHTLSEHRLLLISEEKYIEQFHIQVIQEDGNKVVIRNPGHLPRDRVAEDFVWAQWDMVGQRLYYIDLKKSRSILKCIQFSVPENFTLMFEAPLDISLNDSGLKLVNFGCDYLQDQEKLSTHATLCVFTSKTGVLCACYSPKFEPRKQITYSVFYFHKGYRKTYTPALGSVGSHVTEGVTFLNLDYYVAVCLPGHFFHLLNIQHPDLICHSLFLTGKNALIDLLPPSPLQSLPGSLVLDGSSGMLSRALLDQPHLLQLLWESPLDCEKMALLHCALAWGRHSPLLETQVIQWISENISACRSFDLIQEILIASSYWSVQPERSNADELLPHSSVLSWNTDIPGLTFVTEEIALPLMKVRSLTDDWEKLNYKLDCVKYAKRPLYYNNSVIKREWSNLLREENTGKRRSTAYVRNILDSATKVISNLEARNSERRLAPLFQEEDRQQRLLMGLMVSELRDHLLSHLQGVEKKEIEQMVLDYISKLLDLICRILEASWRNHELHSWALHFDRRGSAAEFAVFHLMTRILEATNSLFLPLPPGINLTKVVQMAADQTVLWFCHASGCSVAGWDSMTPAYNNNHFTLRTSWDVEIAVLWLLIDLPLLFEQPYVKVLVTPFWSQEGSGFHTLHMALGVQCLPLHNLLHYIDDGVLLLTETAVTRLMKDLDNTERNERLKFSIVARLPPLLGQKMSRLWDHPVSSSIISRNHVKRLLQDHKKQPRESVIDKTSFRVEFLPLNYFIDILTDIESSNPALYACEGHDNVDAKFVEEAALKHTTMLLGL